MQQRDEAPHLFSAVWVFFGLMFVGVLLYGFGSSVAESIFGPDEAKVRQECVNRARADKDRCVNGGVGGSLFKTKARIQACDEIYRKDLEVCG